MNTSFCTLAFVPFIHTTTTSPSRTSSQIMTSPSLEIDPTLSTHDTKSNGARPFLPRARGSDRGRAAPARATRALRRPGSKVNLMDIMVSCRRYRTGGARHVHRRQDAVHRARAHGGPARRSPCDDLAHRRCAPRAELRRLSRRPEPGRDHRPLHVASHVPRRQCQLHARPGQITAEVERLRLSCRER